MRERAAGKDPIAADSLGVGDSGGAGLERDIETALEARTSRACVFMPSGRFAIHLAFRLLLSPGDRILMSPLEDDTVFFGALAAGLRPVMAPVSTHDGNVRFEAVDNAAWSNIAAVLTGNTYGLPDRVVEARSRCDQLKIPLIEDAAHALETRGPPASHRNLRSGQPSSACRSTFLGEEAFSRWKTRTPAARSSGYGTS